MSFELPSGPLRLRIDLLSHKDLPYIKSLSNIKIEKITNEYMIIETDKDNVAKLEALDTVIVITPLVIGVPMSTYESIIHGPSVICNSMVHDRN